MAGYKQKPWWVYALLVIALGACLWVGWRDFDPHVPQETVRESIRLGIRGIIQLTVQYVLPVVILLVLVREALVGLHARRTARGKA